MNTVPRIAREYRGGDTRPDPGATPAPPGTASGTPGTRMPLDFIAQGRRVIFINRFFYPDISATSQMLTDLARRLAAQGVDVHVVCSRQLYEGSPVALPAVATVDGVNVHRVWTTRFGRSFLPGRALDYVTFYPAAVCRARAIMRPGDVVVAKTDPPLLSVAIAPVVRRRGALLVNWLQDVFPEVASGVRPGRLAQWLQRPLMYLRDRSLRQARMNVVLGAGMHDYLRDRGIPQSQLRIVENWAVGETMHPVSTEASRLRRSLEVGDRLVVGYSGNLGLAHDHETILAAATVLRDDPGIVFLMVGGGAGMDKLKSGAQECGLDNLRFLPYQPREQLADSLAAADLHLVTQLPGVEGFVVPSKLYGVMAAGRAVIFVGDAAGEVARTVRRAECGFTFANGDGPRLAAELQRLRNDAALRARLGVNAASAYRANYSFEAAAGRWLELLQGVAACGPDR